MARVRAFLHSSSVALGPLGHGWSKCRNYQPVNATVASCGTTRVNEILPKTSLKLRCGRDDDGDDDDGDDDDDDELEEWVEEDAMQSVLLPMMSTMLS